MKRVFWGASSLGLALVAMGCGGNQKAPEAPIDAAPPVAVAEEDLSPVPAPAELAAWGRLRNPSLLIKNGAAFAGLGGMVPQGAEKVLIAEALQELRLGGLASAVSNASSLEFSLFLPDPEHGGGGVVASLPLSGEADVAQLTKGWKSREVKGATFYNVPARAAADEGPADAEAAEDRDPDDAESGGAVGRSRRSRETTCWFGEVVASGQERAQKRPRALCGAAEAVVQHLPYLRRTLSTQASQGDLYIALIGSAGAAKFADDLGAVAGAFLSEQPSMSRLAEGFAKDTSTMVRDAERIELFSTLDKEQFELKFAMKFKGSESPLTRMLLQGKKGVAPPVEGVASGVTQVGAYAGTDFAPLQPRLDEGKAALRELLVRRGGSEKQADALWGLLGAVFERASDPYLNSAGLDFAGVKDELSKLEAQFAKKGKLTEAQIKPLRAALAGWHSYATQRSVEEQLNWALALQKQVRAADLGGLTKKLMAHDGKLSKSETAFVAELTKTLQGLKLTQSKPKAAWGLPEGTRVLNVSFPLGKSLRTALDFDAYSNKPISWSVVMVPTTTGGSIVVRGEDLADAAERAKQALAKAGDGSAVAKQTQVTAETWGAVTVSAANLIASAVRERVTTDALPPKVQFELLSGGEAQSANFVGHSEVLPAAKGGEVRGSFRLSRPFASAVFAAFMANALD